MVAVSAMFPLGTVLFPSMVLPLHVFEPRYRDLTIRCLRDDEGFGVVLIERGSEVGGGDERTDVGTLATITRSQTFSDGRWALVCMGTERIRVRAWLPDDPYPLAEIEPWPDEPASSGAAGALADVTRELRSVLGLAAELGEAVPPATVPVSEDPSVGSHQASALAPLGAADRQVLLSAPGSDERLDRLGQMLADQRELYEARLAMEADPGPDA